MDLEATPSTLQSGTELEATPSTPTIESSSGGAQSPPPNLPAKKKRALPVTDPDVEVISLSPKTLMATNRFVCEVCNKGFQREQNLQLHRRGHNLPWKLKQKDTAPTQRRRVYTCPEPTCAHHNPARALYNLTEIKKHFCRKHREKWNCNKCGKRYALQSHWKAHSKICGTCEYRCDCGTLFSRKDSFITHRASCDVTNMALSLSQAGSHLASTLDVDQHGHYQDPCTEQAMVLPQMSVTWLLQRAAQMGNTSSSSSLMSSNQAITERVVGQQDDIKRRIVDNKHVGIIRRASEKHDIMELIMSQGPCSKRFIVICITGGHGLGKTNLASLVYWDYSICRYFETRVWLCLSDACDYEELLRNVVTSITGVSCRLNEPDELEELLKEELMGKKILLVLDNLCKNYVEVCRHILPLLSMGDKGSAVMVTTNSNLIPEHLGTTHTYNLKALSYGSFLTLAKPTSIEYSPLGSIINKIPSGCSGYPMFAKAICGILYSAFTQKCLDDTVENKLTEIFRKPDNHLRHLLYLSYSYLLPNQKMCLLFLSLFPRDYTYNKEKCLRLWTSLGFIIPEKEKDRQDNCEDAFDELLHGSFFDCSPSSEATEQKYVMHELSSDLVRSASGNKFFRAHDHELHRIPKDVHHLSIVPKQCDSEIYFSSFVEIRNLRTFLLVYNSHSQFHVMDGKALDECFRNFKCLKTLDLSHTDIRELPESVGYISSLCFLGLNNTNIRRLPDSVCNLFNLQTLELQNSAFLVELPNGIRNLNCLYHLDASKECGPIYIPPGIGQLTNLRTLTTFTVGGVSWNCKASELAHLNSLEGFLHIRSLNNVENAEDAKGACLAAKKLKKLSLEWCHGGEDIESDKQISIAEHVLDALKPHCILGELSIKGYYGLKFPSWIADHALSDLVSITLDNCYNCEMLPPLGALPFLRCLFIQNLRGVQQIGCEFWAIGTINDKSFPKLEMLRLRDMYNLEWWYDMLDGDFPSLCSLSIERCPKLNSIPCFRFISDISIMSCNKLSLSGLQSLKSLRIGNMRQRTCFALPFELHSLQMLEVMCCEHLSSVEGLSELQSLKNLKFRTCPRLNFIQDEPLPDTLETVEIHNNCYSLSKWRPHGFEELHDASEVSRKFMRRKCVGKGVNGAMMHELEGHHASISTLTD